MGSGFLNQPCLGCPEKEGRRGPWFADYKPSPWSQVAELSCHNVFPAAFRHLWLPLIIFLLLVFSGERKEYIPACAGMYEAREGTMKQERGTNSKDSCHNLRSWGIT